MNEKIRDKMQRKIDSLQAEFDRKAKSLRASAQAASDMLERLRGVPNLDGEVHLSEYSYSGDTVYVSTKGISTKPEFAVVVRAISEILGELPDTDAYRSQYVSSTSYTAHWPNAKLCLSLYDPKDCILVEVDAEEEVRTTVKTKRMVPHPKCRAALKELEN